MACDGVLTARSWFRDIIQRFWFGISLEGSNPGSLDIVDWLNHWNGITDGTRVLSASEDQTAKIWNSTTGQELHSLNMHTVGVNVACWNPSEDSVLTVADSAKLSHLQVLGVLSTNLKTSNDSLKCVNWHPDGKLLGYSGRSYRRDV